jgi:hypothetical protein
MQQNEIWVIGTDPPCPRCDYLTRMVNDLVVNELHLPVKLKHIAYTSSEAKKFAASLGLEPGTAKDVAGLVETGINWDKVHRLIDVPPNSSMKDSQCSCCQSVGAKWTPELDEALRPCQMKAVEVGIMMTPVLVIAGELKHQGSVPTREQVRMWINQAFPSVHG